MVGSGIGVRGLKKKKDRIWSMKKEKGKRRAGSLTSPLIILDLT